MSSLLKSPVANDSPNWSPFSGDALDVRTVGMDVLIGCRRGRQTARRPVDDVDGATVRVTALGLEGDADDQIREAVVVEVPGGQRLTKTFARLRYAVDAGAVLIEVLVRGGGSRQPARRSVDHVVPRSARPSRLPEGPDGKVSEAVIVEVGCSGRVVGEDPAAGHRIRRPA
jgi:hypothetical protein